LRGNRNVSGLRRRRRQPDYELYRREPEMSRLTEMPFVLNVPRNRLNVNGARKRPWKLGRRLRQSPCLLMPERTRCTRKNITWQYRLSERGMNLSVYSG